MEFAAGAGNENSEEQPGAAFRDLHQQPAGAAELAAERQGQAGGRARQHPVLGRGLQEEVSLELMLYSPGQVQPSSSQHPHTNWGIEESPGSWNSQQ